MDTEEDSASEVVLHLGLMSVVVEAGSRDAGIPDYMEEWLLMPPLGQLLTSRRRHTRTSWDS